MAKGINYFCKTLYHVGVRRFIAIPTTSGTGSEVTSFAVITDTKTGIKYPLVDDSLLPDEANINNIFCKICTRKGDCLQWNGRISSCTRGFGS